MRGHDEQTAHMFSYLSPEQRVPADHPLRAVRALTDEALQTMSRRFASLYATTGRPSIPPEQLLRALLLQVLYTVRSERLLMEELNDNLLFRWFVGLNMDDPVWHPTTFTKNRDRLLSGDVAAAFFDAVQAHARAAGRLSDEHFTVDGTQLEAWASLKSFRCVDAAESEPEDPGHPTVNFHGERRRNDTHQSTTDPEAMFGAWTQRCGALRCRREPCGLSRTHAKPPWWIGSSPSPPPPITWSGCGGRRGVAGQRVPVPRSTSTG